MSPASNEVPGTPEEIVSAFYAALNAHDGDRTGELVDRHFHQDVVAVFPPSLPYGGEVRSARRLRTMFGAMATGAVGVGPASVEVRQVVAGPDAVAVRLDFDWRPPAAGAAAIPSGALELWSFTDGRVREIRAYYWDTAALADRAPARS